MLRVLGFSAMVALVVAAPSYDRSKRRAQRIDNLGRFLERTIGDCDSDDPTFNKSGCESEAKKHQRRIRGKLFLLEVDSSEQIQFSAWDKRRDAYRLHLTPFFSERGVGLSVGKPRRLTREGFPVVKNIPIWVKRPKGEPEFGFRRQLERGMVRLELLLKAKGAWRLKQRGGENVRGLEMALVGVRVYPSRGEKVLAEQTY